MAWNLLPKVSPKTSEIQEETKEGDKLRLMASCCSVLWQKSSSYELNGIRFLAHFVTICITESMSHLGHSVAMCGRYVDEQPLTPWNGLGLNDPPGPILLVRSSKCSTHRRRFSSCLCGISAQKEDCRPASRHIRTRRFCIRKRCKYTPWEKMNRQHTIL
jgi:hypothetical protein